MKPPAPFTATTYRVSLLSASSLATDLKCICQWLSTHDSERTTAFLRGGACQPGLHPRHGAPAGEQVSCVPAGGRTELAVAVPPQQPQAAYHYRHNNDSSRSSQKKPCFRLATIRTATAGIDNDLRTATLPGQTVTSSLNHASSRGCWFQLWWSG